MSAPARESHSHRLGAFIGVSRGVLIYAEGVDLPPGLRLAIGELHALVRQEEAYDAAWRARWENERAQG